MKGAAILGWTGRGALGDLSRTTRSKLPRGARVTNGARSLTVRGEDPIAVARRLAHLPGIAWIAVGYEFGSFESCIDRLSVLASRYLRPGESFKVTAEVEGRGKEEGDVLIEATTAILKAAGGTAVDEKNPRVRFRIVMVGGSGACGVQLREGVGGVPTSRKLRASVLVSGGYHSSVTAWMAAVSGYTLTMVHARDDDESLRQVARLYAELSRRMDASNLTLTVLEGDGPTGDRVAAWLERANAEAFTGVHPQCRGAGGLGLLRRYKSALFPLLLLQEPEVRAKLDELGLRTKPSDSVAGLKVSRRKTAFTTRSFGGLEADQNAVLDSIQT